VKFTTQRPIGDQLLESILEHPNEWEIRSVLRGALDRGSSVILEHNRSGLTLHVYPTNRIIIAPPAMGWESPSDMVIESLKFSDEENNRICKAVMELKKEKKLEERKSAEQALVDLLNQPEKKHNYQKVAKIAFLIFVSTAFLIISAAFLIIS